MCSLTNYQGQHFIKGVVAMLVKEFMIHHHKMMLYHLQANNMIDAFNKILEYFLTKVCSISRDNWNKWIHIILCAYKTRCKTLIKHTLFNLVYGRALVMLLEYFWHDRLDMLVHLQE